MAYRTECIDAGSEFCPCYLAEVNECIMCTQLNGKVFCDCYNWKGVCIYQEYVWNRRAIKSGRKTILSQVIKKEAVAEDVMLLQLRVNRTLARELDQPGAYVFLRSVREPAFFDTPMSIMTAEPDEGIIQIAFQKRGVKTKALELINGDLLVRGPYWNGLLGLKYLKMLRNQQALIVTRGVGQAPAVAVAKKLIMSGNTVDVVLDAGRAGVNFAEEYFLKLGCSIIHQRLLDSKTLTIPPETLGTIENLIRTKNVGLVYSGGSDKLHEGISRRLQDMKSDIPLTCSNDAKFCCGEGVCGSCQTRLSNGKRIKTCKTQINPLEIFGGRQENEH